MTVKELIEILEQYKNDKDRYDQEVAVFILDGDNNLCSLWENNITTDSDGDIILRVRW